MVYPEIVRYTVITDIVQKALNYSTYIVMGTKGFYNKSIWLDHLS